MGTGQGVRAGAAEIAAVVATLPGDRVTVGISGFGGAGKSTLTHQLIALVPHSVRVRGDDFLEPARSHLRSPDWDGMERMRLRREVLDPFRAGEPSRFRRYDWSVGRLGDPVDLPDARVVIVDAVGLFHPELDGAFDVTVWLDVDLQTATARGKQRDRERHNDHDALWDDVWVPTELAFAASFNPRARADYLVEN